jgi:hypothetical protein
MGVQAPGMTIGMVYCDRPPRRSASEADNCGLQWAELAVVAAWLLVGVANEAACGGAVSFAGAVGKACGLAWFVPGQGMRVWHMGSVHGPSIGEALNRMVVAVCGP